MRVLLATDQKMIGLSAHSSRILEPGISQRSV
jgi:hypothetical protein